MKKKNEMINRLDELLINVMASDKKLFKYLSLIIFTTAHKHSEFGSTVHIMYFWTLCG